MSSFSAEWLWTVDSSLRELLHEKASKKTIKYSNKETYDFIRASIILYSYLIIKRLKFKIVPWAFDFLSKRETREVVKKLIMAYPYLMTQKGRIDSIIEILIEHAYEISGFTYDWAGLHLFASLLERFFSNVFKNRWLTSVEKYLTIVKNFKDINVPIQISTTFLMWTFQPFIYKKLRLNVKTITNLRKHQYVLLYKTHMVDAKKKKQAFCAIYTHGGDAWITHDLLSNLYLLNQELKSCLGFTKQQYNNYDSYITAETHAVFHEAFIKDSFHAFNNSDYIKSLANYLTPSFYKELVENESSENFLGYDLDGPIVKF